MPKRANLTGLGWGAPQEMVLDMTYRKCSLDEISKAADMPRGTLADLRESPEFRRRLAMLHERVHQAVIKNAVSDVTSSDARDYLKTNQLKAAKKIVTLMDSKNPLIAFKAAQDVLDRTGLKPIDVVETRERPYTPEEVSRARETLTEVETIITRLENQDSAFLMAKQTRKTISSAPSSSVTDQGSDEPNAKDDAATE